MTEEFDIEKTVSVPFASEDGGADHVMMMRKELCTIEFGEGDGYKAVRLHMVMVKWPCIVFFPMKIHR